MWGKSKKVWYLARSSFIDPYHRTWFVYGHFVCIRNEKIEKFIEIWSPIRIWMPTSQEHLMIFVKKHHVNPTVPPWQCTAILHLYRLLHQNRSSFFLNGQRNKKIQWKTRFLNGLPRFFDISNWEKFHTGKQSFGVKIDQFWLLFATTSSRWTFFVFFFQNKKVYDKRSCLVMFVGFLICQTGRNLTKEKSNLEKKKRKKNSNFFLLFLTFFVFFRQICVFFDKFFDKFDKPEN